MVCAGRNAVRATAFASGAILSTDVPTNLTNNESMTICWQLRKNGTCSYDNRNSKGSCKYLHTLDMQCTCAWVDSATHRSNRNRQRRLTGRRIADRHHASERAKRSMYRRRPRRNPQPRQRSQSN